MHWLAIKLALLLALGIIAIGTLYVVNPMTATRSFGLPLPENGASIAWWLCLKGVRDIAVGFDSAGVHGALRSRMTINPGGIGPGGML
jgi:hypothetical protein